MIRILTRLKVRDNKKILKNMAKMFKKVINTTLCPSKKLVALLGSAKWPKEKELFVRWDGYLLCSSLGLAK